MSVILECSNLIKSFGSNHAVAGIDLKIQRGRIVGLLGPNGSGKTTIIKLANDLLTPTAGDILINGKKPGVETKKIVSYLPEKTYLNNWMKVYQIISKLLISVMWIFFSSVTAMASVLIIASQGITLSEMFIDLSMLWNRAYSFLGASLYHLIIQMAIGLIVSVVTSILLIYVSIALGHLSNNHKILASIGAFLCIYTIVQIISGILFIGSDRQGLIYTLTQQSFYPFALIWLAIAISAVFAAVYFIITNTILNKRLNLE